MAGSVSTFAWGNGDFGQLGLGSTDIVALPQLVEGLKGREVVLAVGNLYNSAFLLGELSFASEENILLEDRVQEGLLQACTKSEAM